MLAYIVRRCAYTIVVVLTLLTSLFFILHAIPGDPAAALTRGWIDKTTAETLKKHLGLDKPAAIQYIYYMRNLFTGDLGNSYYYDLPTIPLVMERIPATAELAFSATCFSLILGVMLGGLAGVYVGSIWDWICMSLALIGQSLPGFWVGIMLILLFARTLHVLPTSGRGGLNHLVLPMVATALPFLAVTTRLVRSSLLEVLHMDYIRTARAKGASELSVVIRHALRNSLVSVVTYGGLQLGYLLGGVVIIETVFAWPGLGSLAINSILRRDYPVILLSIATIATFFMLINLLVDISYVYLNPRIRLD